MKKNDRFIEVYKECNGFTTSTKTILVDSQTGVNYIFVKSGYAGGLTPLLDSQGNAVITPITKNYDNN